MKKFLALVLAAMMLMGATAALADVTVSWYTFGDVYLTSVRTALDAALTEKGLTPNDRDANAAQQTQIDDITTALASNTDAVLVNLVDSGAIGTAQSILENIKAQGKPAVFFNRAVSQDNKEAADLFATYEKSCFVGTKFEEAGMMQGKMIGEYVLAHYDELDLNKDGVISYVMFKGDEANQEAIARTKYGQEEADKVLVAAGKPALKFYDESNEKKYLVDMNGTWSNVASNDYMQTILSQYNEANNNMVELVICNNDDMAIGAINALSAAGYNTGAADSKVIPVFGVDAVDAAKEKIKEGVMAGTIKQDAEGMADAVATIAANMVAGKDKYDNLNEKYTVNDGWFVTIPYSVYTGE